jgi:hypothetical protein
MEFDAGMGWDGSMSIDLVHPHLLEKMRPRLEKWKNKYKGERAFLIGNGSSLSQIPLYLLNNEYTFALNKIAAIYPTTTWRPSFYINVTWMTTDDGHAMAAVEAMKQAPSFIGYRVLERVLEVKDEEAKLPDDVYPIRCSKRYRETTPNLAIWSHDIANRVSKYGSSMMAVFQIAVYMGFNPLILVGCDLGWKPFDYENDIDPNHFCEDYWSKPILHGEKELIATPELVHKFNADALSCHVLAKEICDRLGVEIYNATVGGELEIHPRVDFMEIINED